MRKDRFIAVDTEAPPKRCHRFGAGPFDLFTVNGFHLSAPKDKHIREAGRIDILANCAMAPEPGVRHDLHGHFSLTAATSCNVIFHPMNVLGNDCACQRSELSASCAVLCIAADSGFARQPPNNARQCCKPTHTEVLAACDVTHCISGILVGDFRKSQRRQPCDFACGVREFSFRPVATWVVRFQAVLAWQCFSQINFPPRR